MDDASLSFTQEFPEISFEFSHKNQDNIIISFGPKNGFLWRGEGINIQEISLIDGLNKVFQVGFQAKGGNVCQNLPYMQSRYPDFIGASNTYSNGGEFVGLDNEQFSAGDYGYIYLIDTDKENNIQSIPLCEENILNQAFVANYIGEQITEGPDYAIILNLDPKYIIGAIPSEFVAYALGIKEKSFIINPAYQGILYFDKIKEFSEIRLFSTLNELSLKYPNLTMDEIYESYSASEEAVQSSSSSTVANVTFFNRLPFKPEYIQKHTPLNYNTGM